MHITTSRQPMLATLWLLLIGQVAGQGYWVNSTNASGSVPVPGFRLDRPYPGSWDDAEANSRSWSLNVNVTDSQGFASLSIWLAPPPAGSPEGALFGTNATSNATNNWIVPQNVTDTWRVVIVWFDKDEWRTVQDPNDSENGTCPPSVLSAECKLGLRDFVRRMPETVYNMGVPGTMYAQMTHGLKNCNGYTKLYQKLLPLSSNYYSHAQELYSYGNPLDGANTYDKFGSRTFPVMLIWAREINRNVTGSIVLPTIDDEHITFACVKADTLFQGNGTLPDGSEWLHAESGGSANGGPRSALVWSAGIAAAVSMVV
ncbi:hypothetical protein MN608_08595 [Microdochium nivale]|nr:hypothetical protein MN608_08595 [Microdochium nivale]